MTNRDIDILDVALRNFVEDLTEDPEEEAGWEESENGPPPTYEEVRDLWRRITDREYQ